MQGVSEIAQTLSMRTQPTIFSQSVLQHTHTQNAIRGNHVFLGKNLNVQKGCVLE